MTVASAGSRLEAMRRARPLVHNITNFAAANFVANALLAAGATPAMAYAREETSELAARADALTINIGTLSPAWHEGMTAAVAAARRAGRPWVLDPVAAGATAARRRAAEELALLHPTVIRGNAAEIATLAGAPSAGKGPDAPGGHAPGGEPAARALARRTSGVVAVTGELDWVTDGARIVTVANGHPLMRRVTGVGCGLTGVIGAFLAGADDPLDATVAALAFYGRVGEVAGAGAGGPGSFAAAFLDALAALDGSSLDAHARIVVA